MANDRDDRVDPSKRKRPVRKTLGEDGLPRTPATGTEKEAADRTKMTVTEETKPSPQRTG